MRFRGEESQVPFGNLRVGHRQELLFQLPLDRWRSETRDRLSHGRGRLAGRDIAEADNEKQQLSAHDSSAVQMKPDSLH